MVANDLLRSDRTVKNELHKLTSDMTHKLKHSLLEAVKNKALSISPDNWTDNHRGVTYMGATAHLIDEDLNYESMDLFCVEFVEKKKTAENIYQVSQT